MAEYQDAGNDPNLKTQKTPAIIPARMVEFDDDEVPFVFSLPAFDAADTQLDSAEPVIISNTNGGEQVTSKSMPGTPLMRSSSYDAETPLSVSDMKKQKNIEAEAMKPWTQKTPFQCVVALVIVANAVCMTIEAEDSGENAAGLLVMEHLFAATFVLEFAVRIKYEGFREYFSHTANSLDFCLVMLAVVDVWIIKQLGLDKDIDLGSASLLRMMRLLKLGRILKLFHMFRELTVILQGLLGGLRTLFWAGLFLFLLLYLFAMVGTLNFGGASSCDEPVVTRLLKGASGGGATAQSGGNLQADDPGNVGCTEFSSVGRSLLTLWLCLTEGCGDGIIKPMTLEQPYLFVYWIIFVFIGSFGILNIIIGLFCENVLFAAAEAEKAMGAMQNEVRKSQMQALKHLFVMMDADGSQSLSYEEWCSALAMPEVCDILEKLGLAEEDDIWEQLDVNKGGMLDFEEFFDGLLLIVKGTDAAVARDVVPTFLTCQLIRKKTDSMQGNIDDLHAKMDAKVEALQAEMRSNHQELLHCFAKLAKVQNNEWL